MPTELDVNRLGAAIEAGADPRRDDAGTRLSGSPVVVRPSFDATLFYRHGWQSWSDTRWVDPAIGRPLTPVPELVLQGEDPGYSRQGRHAGSHVGAVQGPDGSVLLLGALGLGGRVELDDGALVGRYEDEAGEWFVAHGSEQDVFVEYAARLGSALGSRKRPTPRVWCSWYSMYSDIDEQRMLEALEGVQGLPFDSFQVDDGWQRDIGDWEPNAAFPSGMTSLAQRIRAAGLLPGLWMAPFIVHERSSVATDQHQWLLRDEHGSPAAAGNGWGGDYYALDLTHPEAREWVGERIRRSVEWGFGYLKLDFLYAGALPGRRHEDQPRELAYRSGIELVREAAGESTYLLACGAPIVPSVGVFDGIRVGPDVAPWWENDLGTRYLYALAVPNTRYAIVTSLHRLWLRPIIDTDPDVAYFRSRYQMLNPTQQRLLRDLARVAEFRATSDPPGWLDPEEREALSAFLDESPEVRRLGRYRYAIDGREVDFSVAVEPPPEYRGPVL